MLSQKSNFRNKDRLKHVFIFGVCFLGLLVFIDRSPSSAYFENSKQASLTVESDHEFPGKCRIKNYERLKRSAVVYTWVNGSIPCYREIRKKHGGENAIGGSRDREMGELKYSIRSLQKYMPWHEGPIYIVTPGHIPDWLKLRNSRIHVINQDDLFPEYAKGFLPSFNTHVIEQFLYRIPGLTDIFIQINDDYIFTKPMPPHAFFTCDGGVKLLQERSTISHTPPTPDKGIWISSVLNTQQELDLAFGIHDRYYIKHAPFVYARRSFERLHQIFARPLYMTLKSKFRAKPDMNLPILNMYYMVHQGAKELGIPIEIPPQEEVSGYYLILLQDDNMESVQEIFNDILAGKQKGSVYALNDEYSKPEVAQRVRKFLQEFLPNPSEFERKDSDPITPTSMYDPATCQINYDLFPPQAPRNDSVIAYTVRHYEQSKTSMFISSIIHGAGITIGLLIGMNIYLYILKWAKGWDEKDYAYHV